MNSDYETAMKVARMLPPDRLARLAQGQDPVLSGIIPPMVAASAMHTKNVEQQKAQQSQQAAGAPQDTTLKQVMQQGMGALAQQQVNQQKNMQQMAMQAAQIPSGAVAGGPPVQAARGGLMSIARFQEGGPVTSGQRMLAEYMRRLRTMQAMQGEMLGTPARMAREALGGISMPEDLAFGPKITFPQEDPDGFYARRRQSKGARERQQRGAENRSALNRAERGMPEPQAAREQWTRMSPEQEREFARRAAASPGAEIAQAWQSYKSKFPDAGTGAIGAPSGQTRTQLNAAEPRSAPPTSSAQQPSAGPMEQGIGALKAPRVEPRAPNRYEDMTYEALQQLGGDAPSVTGRDPRLIAAQRALFAAQQEGKGGWRDTVNTAVSGLRGSNAENPLLQNMDMMTAMNRAAAERRMAPAQFEHDQTVADVEAEGAQAEARRKYVERAREQRIAGARPLAEQGMQQSGQDARANQEAERVYGSEALKHRNAMELAGVNNASDERQAGMRGAGGESDFLKAINARRLLIQQQIKDIQDKLGTPVQQATEAGRRGAGGKAYVEGKLAERDRLVALLATLDAQVASGGVAPAPTDAATGGSGTRMKFDAKGNPIP
jgi:hypothetical protein